MHRRLLIAATAALALSACTAEAPSTSNPAPAAAFASERITVTTRGSGPDIILIHGLAAHPDVWNDAAEQLDDRYRLHLIQIHGFAGAPERANADGPVAAPVAEEIARYIRESGLKKPAVVGHSMGGSIAMMIAARHPDLPGRVMVVDMVPFMGAVFGPPGTTRENVTERADTFRNEILTKDDTLGPMIPTMTRKDSARPALLKYVAESNMKTVANAFHELFVTDLTPELSRIRAPLTVLYVIPPGVPGPTAEFEAGVRQMYSAAPRAHLVRIDESNHYIQIDQPARFVAEVDAFMKR